MNLTDDIRSIKGIGEKTALLFSKASVFCVNDLVHYFPRNYLKMPQICDINNAIIGESAVLKVKIISSPIIFKKGYKQILSFKATDSSNNIIVYYFGMPYLKKELYSGRELMLYGIVNNSSKGLCISNPKILTEEEYNSSKNTLSPVYPLISGLTNNMLVKSLKCIKNLITNFKEYLPNDIKDKYNLISLSDALYKIHFPQNMDDVYAARKRLAFDEFFFFLIKLKVLKGSNEKIHNKYKIINESIEDDIIKKLPYSLTNAQKNAIKDIVSDISSDYLMNRLIQGDVGSGKTIVAIIASYIMIKNGFQAALMAPTQVLANQHYQDLIKMENEYNLGIKPVLLCGNLTAKEKRLAKEGIKSGDYNFIIGTNALITDDVEYANLAIAITDEQHRFGVRQRLSLMNKGNNVHVLVMSATPIPRTLGLILYGDLDVSVIDELPANRLPIKNSVIGPEYRSKAYDFIKKSIYDGRQAYIICPMVEEGELENITNVKDYTENIKSIFPNDINISMLHGKMKAKEKDEIMNSFKDGNIDILVSTTVIEVGVNVPNASVILIENSERFGLAQLHQLRGRVGRGEYQSYCMFMTGNNSDVSRKRLEILGKTNDGFKVASEDLKQRGPGDFFGLRQSGLPMFKIADIYTDSKILANAKDAIEMFDNISELENIVDKENTSFIDFHLICL